MRPSCGADAGGIVRLTAVVVVPCVLSVSSSPQVFCASAGWNCAIPPRMTAKAACTIESAIDLNMRSPETIHAEANWI